MSQSSRLLAIALLLIAVAIALLLSWSIARADAPPERAAVPAFAPAPAFALASTCGIGHVTKCYRNRVGLWASVRWGVRIFSVHMPFCRAGMPVPICR
jgi:hypothetical protein